jgi:hypothetical protein
MLMSIFASPYFAASLVSCLLGRKPSFVVTPKGESTTTDSWRVFRRPLVWAAIFGGALLLSIRNQLATSTTLMWPLLSLVFCLAPYLLSKWREAAIAVPVAPQDAPDIRDHELTSVGS